MEILENFKICKVGDKLQVRKNLKKHSDEFPSGLDDNGAMETFENKIVTITYIMHDYKHIRIKEDLDKFIWNPNMFYKPILYDKFWE